MADINSPEYKEFAKNADTYSYTSVNGVPGGQYRMTNAEGNITAQRSAIGAVERELNSVKANVTESHRRALDSFNKLREMFIELTQVVSDINDRLASLMDEDPITVVKLDDEEFFAAAADPKAYDLRG